MGFGYLWEFWVQFCLKKLVLTTFKSDHLVKPLNSPSKDSKTADAWEFARTAQSPLFLDWSVWMEFKMSAYHYYPKETG